MTPKLRIQYATISLTNFGIGYLELHAGFVRVVSKAGDLDFPVADSEISIGGPGSVSNHTFSIDLKDKSKRVTFSFIGPEESAVLGFSQDFKEDEKTFIRYVSTVQGEKSNFRPDGTYKLRWSGLDARSKRVVVVVGISTVLGIAGAIYSIFFV